MTRTVFAGANVFDGANPIRPDAQVVVEGNRIVSVDATHGRAAS